MNCDAAGATDDVDADDDGGECWLMAVRAADLSTTPIVFIAASKATSIRRSCQIS